MCCRDRPGATVAAKVALRPSLVATFEACFSSSGGTLRTSVFVGWVFRCTDGSLNLCERCLAQSKSVQCLLVVQMCDVQNPKLRLK